MLRSLAVFLAVSVTWAALPLPASAFPIPARPQPVVEFYNTIIDHYFLTIDPAEMAAIDAGSAGPGWIRTGFAFEAYPSPVPPGTYCPGDCGVPVHRFYGKPGIGPNSHFYTADPAEAAFLRTPASEWLFERVEFSLPLPDANGQCPSQLVPVHRFYNGREAFRDGNHRFAADAPARAKMIAAGWRQEGVAFCAYARREVPIKSLEVAVDLREKIMPSARCEDESINLGPCLALNNLPTPDTELGPYFSEPAPAAFFDRTGLSLPRVFVVGNGTPEAAAQNVFVQGAALGTTTSVLGIHVDSRDRGSRIWSSVNPLYQLRTSVAPGTFDARFFPFGPSEDAVELRVSFDLHVKRLSVRNDQSHAYGHPTLEFTDRSSGRNLYVTAGTYGTVALGGTFLAVDEFTGKVIVGSSLTHDSPYLRNLGLAAIQLPRDFTSPFPTGTGGSFEFRIGLAEFQRVLEAARTLQPQLSANPADYLLDNFHFNNEVVNDGEIGLRLWGYTLQLVRKP